MTHRTTPQDVAEDWRERSAIMEVDGELSRKDAEAAAWDRMAENYGRHLVARGIVEAMKRGWM
jgi:hypothetical protein